jgi:hypothetical protein
MAMIRAIIGDRIGDVLEKDWLAGPYAWRQAVIQEWDRVVKARRKGELTYAQNKFTRKNFPFLSLVGLILNNMKR